MAKSIGILELRKIKRDYDLKTLKMFFPTE